MTRIRAAFIALIIASVALAAYGDRISGNGPEFMSRDPGAIRASGGGPEAQWIDFAHEEDAPAYAEGRVFWDADNECLAFYPEQPDTIMQLGQEMWCRVKNEEIATMTNGTVVYLSPPNTGSDPVAKRADANTATQSTVIGVITHDISPDASGYVTVSGLVRNLNTSGMVEGGKVFLSETPGSFTATLPAAPATSLVVGYVLKAHATAGMLFVRVWLNGSIEPAVFHDTAYFSKPVTFASGSTPLSMMTDIGGHAIALYNGSGVIASAGNIVSASSTAGFFTLTPDDSAAPIGAVYQDVAPGAQGWVVVSGIGDVKMMSSQTATSGWLLLTSKTEAGVAQNATEIPPTTQADHNREIGHTISTQPTAGGLVRAVLHFN